MQEVYARMLANAGDAESGTEARTAFPNMLSQMSYLDVRVRAQLVEVSSRDLRAMTADRLRV